MKRVWLCMFFQLADLERKVRDKPLMLNKHKTKINIYSTAWKTPLTKKFYLPSFFFSLHLTGHLTRSGRAFGFLLQERSCKIWPTTSPWFTLENQKLAPGNEGLVQMIFLFNQVIFSFDVNFPACNSVSPFFLLGGGGQDTNIFSSLYHMSVEAQTIWITC